MSAIQALLVSSAEGESTPWNLNYASYTGQPLPAYWVQQDGAPAGFDFKSDGTVLFVVGFGTDAVYQYTLGTAWSIATASYTSKSFSVATQDTTPRDVKLSPDGLKVFVLGDSSNTIYLYNLSVAWDLSTATYSGTSFFVGSQSTTPRGFTFNSTGTAMYLSDGSTLSPTGRCYQYTLSTAWDISTMSYASKFFTAGFTLYGICLSSDGVNMYLVKDASPNNITQFTLSTPGDISTATSTGNTFATSALDSSPAGLFLKPDGSRIYMSGILSSDSVYQIEMPTAYSIASAQFAVNVPELCFIGGTTTYPQSLRFLSDGLTFYMLENLSTDLAVQYTLTSAWQVKTASYANKFFNFNSQDTVTEGICVKPDGTKLFMLGATNDRLYEYTFGTTGDISTLSYTSNFFSISGQTTSPQCFFCSDDGTRLYLASATDDRVYEYSLSTGWDLTTISYTGRSISVLPNTVSAYDIYISPDGQYMFLLNNGGDNITQYLLYTPWNISTAVYWKQFSVSAQETSPRTMTFKPDGLSFYVAGPEVRTIYQYTIA